MPGGARLTPTAGPFGRSSKIERVGSFSLLALKTQSLSPAAAKGPNIGWSCFKESNACRGDFGSVGWVQPHHQRPRLIRVARGLLAAGVDKVTGAAAELAVEQIDGRVIPKQFALGHRDGGDAVVGFRDQAIAGFFIVYQADGPMDARALRCARRATRRASRCIRWPRRPAA